jgi:hypothetical protein
MKQETKDLKKNQGKQNDKQYSDYFHINPSSVQT